MCGAEILLRPQCDGGGRRANTAGHNTGRLCHSLAGGRGRFANGHRCLSSQHGVPLQEPASVAVTRVRIPRLKVARLERRDDGHGSGVQRRWKEGCSLIQAGAGDLGPSLSGCEVRERGPAEEGADSSTGRITPSGRGKNRNGRLRMRDRVVYIVTFTSRTPISLEK